MNPLTATLSASGVSDTKEGNTTAASMKTYVIVLGEISSIQMISTANAHKQKGGQGHWSHLDELQRSKTT